MDDNTLVKAIMFANSNLNKRQHQIAPLVATGASNKQIAGSSRSAKKPSRIL